MPDKNYPDHFTTTDIDRRLGIKRNRIKNWLMEWFILPTFEVETSRGMKSYFGKEALYRLKLFEQLVEMGVPRRTASVLIYPQYMTYPPHLREQEMARLRKEEKVAGPRKAYDFAIFHFEDRGGSGVIGADWRDAGQVLELDKRVGHMHIINYARLREQVDAAMEE